MSIEDLFKKVEEVNNEKIIKKLNCEELLQEFIKWYEKNYYFHSIGCDGKLEYFHSVFQFLKSYEMAPVLISNFYQKIKKIKERKESLGLFLSAMIQTSYDQGWNNFTFDKIEADCFGAFLKGLDKKRLILNVGKINGNLAFFYSDYCEFTAKEICGMDTMTNSTRTKLKVENLSGNFNFWGVEECDIEIDVLEGRFNLGHAKKCNVFIHNLGYSQNNVQYFFIPQHCIFISQNENTLKIIEEQTKNKTNKYILKKGC